MNLGFGLLRMMRCSMQFAWARLLVELIDSYMFLWLNIITLTHLRLFCVICLSLVLHVVENLCSRSGCNVLRGYASAHYKFHKVIGNHVSIFLQVSKLSIMAERAGPKSFVTSRGLRFNAFDDVSSGICIARILMRCCRILIDYWITILGSRIKIVYLID